MNGDEFPKAPWKWREKKEEPKGTKHDTDKPDYSLLSFHALEELVKVLTFGAKKYSRDNWKAVPDFHHRYMAAALRHITAHARGEERDPETGCMHLSHAVATLMFLVEDRLTKGDDNA